MVIFAAIHRDSWRATSVLVSHCVWRWLHSQWYCHRTWWCELANVFLVVFTSHCCWQMTILQRINML